MLVVGHRARVAFALPIQLSWEQFFLLLLENEPKPRTGTCTQPGSKPGPEEKLAVHKPNNNTTWARILAKPVSFLISSTWFKRLC